MTSGKCFHRHAGFTLVEVMIALGIAAGALILLFSANRESLRRSVRSSQSERIESLMQSKLDEVCSGIEHGTSGNFEEMPLLFWNVQREKAEIGNLKGVEVVHLQIKNGDGAVERSLRVYHYAEPTKQ